MARSFLLLFSVLLLCLGCAAPKSAHYGVAAERGLSDHLGEAEADIGEGRIFVKTASVTLSVKDPQATGRKVQELVKESGGFVESVSESGRGGVNLTVRVPSADIEPVLDRIGGLGRETARSLNVSDVTERYTDMEARLKNVRALRDRLRDLLKEAKNVADIVAIEKELSKAQSELDSLEGRLKALRSRVQMSEVQVWIKKRKVLGPLGYVFKGIAWFVEKLFILEK